MKYLHRLHSPDQRSTYRVRAAGDEAILWVGLPTGPVEVPAYDISARGCSFVLSEEDAKKLEIDGDVVLRMRVGGEGTSMLFVRAVVKNHVPMEDEGVRVGVAFRDAERLYTQLDERQWNFFNRRAAFRVVPATADGGPVVASFYLPGKRRPRAIPIHDLSSSGMAVEIDADEEVEFSETRPMRVTFTLPLDGSELDMKVLFVHRTPRAGRRRVGFRFDPGSTPRFESQTETILRYVLERQRQLVSDP